LAIQRHTKPVPQALKIELQSTIEAAPWLLDSRFQEFVRSQTLDRVLCEVRPLSKSLFDLIIV
jgi:hypothetical protein